MTRSFCLHARSKPFKGLEFGECTTRRRSLNDSAFLRGSVGTSDFAGVGRSRFRIGFALQMRNNGDGAYGWGLSKGAPWRCLVRRSNDFSLGIAVLDKSSDWGWTRIRPISPANSFAGQGTWLIAGASNIALQDPIEHRRRCAQSSRSCRSQRIGRKTRKKIDRFEHRSLDCDRRRGRRFVLLTKVKFHGEK